MKLGRKLVSLLLALVMVFSLTATASAAATETVTVKLRPNITVTLDGEAQAMADVNGNPVYPVLYGGTTYLPVRAVGNMLGLAVDWEQSTKTVLLSDPENEDTPTQPSTKTPADAKPTDISVEIRPDIKVKYNGKTQKMTNVNGDRVYPMLYGGTTYLPVRAVANMLALIVGWDQDTQTVGLELNIVDRIALWNEDGTQTMVDLTQPEAARKELKAHGWADEFIDRAINGPRDSRSFFKLLDDIDRASDDYFDYEYTDMHTYTAPDGREVEIDAADPDCARDILAWAGFPQNEIDQIMFDLTDPLLGAQTSEDAKVLGDKHIGYDWAEIDWSTANKGYVRVKINTEIAAYVSCGAECYNEAEDQYCYSDVNTNIAQIDAWQNLPLRNPSGGKYECMVTVRLNGLTSGYKNGSTVSKTLQARFTAEINAPESNNVWLMSHMRADYENAPNICAKAQEITKNCKTDAEKIEAVFKFVASNISYDNNQNVHNGTATVSMWQRDMNPDNILKAEKGVCEHYAILMTAMLRSLGIQCKLVDGWMKTDNDEADSEWGGHVWVAVKPATGTLNISGMGKDYAGYDENNKPIDPTGWIRLDPTNAHVPSFTSNDNNYCTDSYY